MNGPECLEVAKGNEQASRFLLSYLTLCHVVDDVEDKDKPVTDERMIRMLIWWSEELLYNEWVKQHADPLWAAVLIGWNSWLDSNQWAKCPNPKLFASDVMKSNYQEIVYLVAYLCGGLEHMRAMSVKHREYQFVKGE